MITPDDLADMKEINDEVQSLVKSITSIDISGYKSETLLIAFSEGLAMIGLTHDVPLSELQGILRMAYKKMLAFN